MDDCFKITSVSQPTKGSASLLDATSVEWKIDELGVKKSEGAVLEFTVQHVGTCSGEVHVNEYTSYDDKEDNDVDFPSPTIEVDCGVDTCAEDCPDVTVRCIRFVLPEDLDVSGSSGVICNQRKFKARFIAHYIDNDFNCFDITI